MRSLLPFLIGGLTSGSVYGLAAMGLVLTFKTSGIFNFAHGAVAAGAAYIFYELHVGHGLPWPVAALAVLLAAPLAGAVFERVARGLTGAPSSAKVVATVGLLLAIQGSVSAVFGAAGIPFATFLPTTVYRLAGVNVGADQLIAMTVAAGAAAGLFTFFRYSRLGVAMRGVVDNPALLDLAGQDPARVRRAAWSIGSAYAALSGILLICLTGVLDPLLLTLLVVQAFGAAAVGGLTSLPMAYAGGLLLGVVGSLATKYVADVPSLLGVPPSLPFIVLFGALLFQPANLRGQGSDRPRLRNQVAVPAPWLWAGRAAVVALLIVAPQLVGTRLSVYINGVIFILVFLSLRLLVFSGQVSLCHAAFAAIGAVVFSHLSVGVGLPWGMALFGAGLATVPLGAVVALPAIRLSGLYLALATLGFGILVERLIFRAEFMFGATGAFRVAPRPGQILGIDFHGDKAFYYLCLVIALLATVGVGWLNQSRLGRLCRAMADSNVALATHGANVNVTRVLVFGISAFIAGVAGGLLGALTGTISGEGFSFFSSLTWLVVLALAGSAPQLSPYLAAGLLAVLPSYVNNQTYIEWQPVLFGVLALIAALAQGGGLPFADRVRLAAVRSTKRRGAAPSSVRYRLAAARQG